MAKTLKKWATYFVRIRFPVDKKRKYEPFTNYLVDSV